MNSGHIFDHTDYKEALRQRLAALKQTKPHLTLKKISTLLPVQYTFLSKVLNSPDSNLSEDHLHKFALILELLPDEIDFLILLRSQLVSADEDRKNYLQKKIESIRKEKIVSANSVHRSSDNLRIEMSYLFNPLCALTYVALFIPDIKKDPRRLISLLGINLDKLKEIFLILEQYQLITVGDSPLEVKKLNEQRFHYSPDHPLMRLHQQIVKSYLMQKMPFVSEANKDSFFVTFSADQESFQKIKIKFRDFLKEVQNITMKSKDKNLYQMSFDLMQWL